MAYGSFQAKGLIRAATADLRQGHNNARPESRCLFTLQLAAALDP